MGFCGSLQLMFVLLAPADLQEMASRYCTPDGTWYFNPNENRTWTNYSLCGYHHEPGSVGNSTLIAVIDVWCPPDVR
jgi:hypothetical protein